jgi:hypothetical protein
VLLLGLGEAVVARDHLDQGVLATEPDADTVEVSVSGELPTFLPAFNSHGLTHVSIPLAARARLNKERFRVGP